MPPARDTHAPRQLVVFSLGSEEYALPIEDVHEIIRYVRPRDVASRDESVCGIISLRGKILPVYDLAIRLGVPRDAGGRPPGKILIVQTGGSASGVVVDDVAEVLTVDADQLDVETTRGVGGTGFDAIARIGDRLVALLDPSVLTADAAVAADAPGDERPSAPADGRDDAAEPAVAA